MTAVIEYMRRRLSGVQRGGREPYVLKTRYDALLPVATANLQKECVTHMRRSLSTDGQKLVQFDYELQVYDEPTAVERLDNVNREYTIALYYRPSKLYYFMISTAAFFTHISPNLGRVVDMYIGYCPRSELHMKPFDGPELLRPLEVEESVSSS